MTKARDNIDDDAMTAVGTLYWCAPEVLYSDGDYNEKADVYSLGITFL